MPGNNDNKVRKRVKQEENPGELRVSGDQQTQDESSPAVMAESLTGGGKCANLVSSPSSFVFTLNINALIAVLTLVSFGTRFWKLEEPRGVV